MSAYIDKDGNLVVKVAAANPAEEIFTRRQAVIDLIVQRNEDFIDIETIYYAMKIIEDTEPTLAQWNAALSVKP